MAISAPLNGAGTGEAFSPNTVGLTDARSLAAAPNTGETLIMYIIHNNNTQITTGIAQTGVQWSLDKRFFMEGISNSIELWVGYANGATPSANFTLTGIVNWSTSNSRLNVSRHTGLGSNPQLQVFGANAELATVVRTPVITPVAASEVLLCAIGKDITGFVSGPTDSFNALASPSVAALFAYRIVASASGSYSTTWTAAGATETTSLIVAVSATAAPANSSYTADLTLVTAAGGLANWPYFFNAKYHKSSVSGSLISAWHDAFSLNASRVRPMALYQNTASLRPADGGTYIQFTAATLQYLLGITRANLLLDGVVPLYMYAVVDVPTNAPICSVRPSETATTAPYLQLESISGKLAAEVSTDGTAPTGLTSGLITCNETRSYTSGVKRCLMVGRGTLVGNTNVDSIIRFREAGRQPHRHVRLKAAAATACKIVVGRDDAAYFNGKIHWLAISLQEPTDDILDLVDAYTAAEHGVTF